MSEKLVQKLKVIAANKISSDSASSKIITEAAEYIEKHISTQSVPNSTQSVPNSTYTEYTHTYKKDMDNAYDVFEDIWGMTWDDFINGNHTQSKKTENKKTYYYNKKETLIFEIHTVIGCIFSKKFKRMVEKNCKIFNSTLLKIEKTSLFNYTLTISHPYDVWTLSELRNEIENDIMDGWWIFWSNAFLNK